MLVASAAGAAGCGGEKRSTSTTAAPTPAVTAPATDTSTQESARTETAPAPTQTQRSETRTTTTPESQPGGAGDEEAARSEVTFTGSGGQITPTSVRVAPFIQIKITLKSKDDRHYAIAVAGRRLNAGLGRGDSSVTIPGLRQEKGYTVRVTAGSPSELKIKASSEPGP